LGTAFLCGGSMEEYVVMLIWGLIVFLLVFLINYFVIFWGVLNKFFKKKKSKKIKIVVMIK